MATPVGVFSQSVCLCVCGDHKSIALEIIRLSLAEPRRYSYISAQAQIHIQILTDTSTHRYKYRQSVLGNSLARLSLKVCPRHAVATLKCLFPIPIPQSIAIRTTPNHLTYIFFLPPACAYHKFICATLHCVCVCVLLTFWVH